MRTLRIVTAIAIACLVVMAAEPAEAKGPRSATIDGPGLDAPIEDSQAGMSKLPALTGLLGALWADTTIPLVDEAPTADLGPAWVITWDMGTYADEAGNENDAPDLVRQTVYPYAEGGPLVHTEAGQPFYAQETVGGWYEAHTALTSMLRMLGLPAESEPASKDGDDSEEHAQLAGSTRAGAGASSEGSSGSSTGRVAGSVLGMVLVAAVVAVAMLRSRRRTVG